MIYCLYTYSLIKFFWKLYADSKSKQAQLTYYSWEIAYKVQWWKNVMMIRQQALLLPELAQKTPTRSTCQSRRTPISMFSLVRSTLRRMRLLSCMPSATQSPPASLPQRTSSGKSLHTLPLISIHSHPNQASTALSLKGQVNWESLNISSLLCPCLWESKLANFKRQHQSQNCDKICANSILSLSCPVHGLSLSILRCILTLHLPPLIDSTKSFD